MDKINKIKKDLEIKTSEYLFGINEQPKEQCPLINEVISQLVDNSKEIKDVWQNLRDVEEAESYLSTLDWAEYNIRNLESNMEEIRVNIEKLRAWGEEWKDFAKQLVIDRQDFFDFIASKHQIKFKQNEETCKLSQNRAI